jgi:hypothetical protein
VLSREWAVTRLADAPDPNTAPVVYGTKEDGHYRLQPLPALHQLVDLDAAEPGTPGINFSWRESGEYPRFVAGTADTAKPDDWVLAPTNLLRDPSFAQPLGQPGQEATSPWVGGGGMHTYVGMACLNLLPNQTQNALAWQKLGPVRPNTQYLLCGDMTVQSLSKDLGAVGAMWLAAGEPGKPIGQPIDIRRAPGKGGSWNTYDSLLRTGAAGADPNVGQDLYVVLAGRVEGPAATGNDPAAFMRWDDLWLLTGP